jgi:hypothetical protein
MLAETKVHYGGLGKGGEGRRADNMMEARRSTLGKMQFILRALTRLGMWIGLLAGAGAQLLSPFNCVIGC